MATFGARCPNHRVVLIKTSTRGIGICPISDARFEYRADESSKTRKIGLDGKITEETKYEVYGDD